MSTSRTSSIDPLFLGEQSADPSTGADQGVVFTKDDGGSTELYFRHDSDGTVTQLTGAGGGAQWIDTGVYLYPAGGATRNVAIGAIAMSASENLRVVGDTLLEGTLSLQGSSDFIGDTYTFDQVQSPANPTAALASPAIAGNVSNGTHSYKVTYVLSSGHETEGGAESNTVTVVDKTVNGKVELTVITQSLHPEVVTKNIYRDKNGDLVYKLVANIPNATVSYTDNIADAGLGATMPTFNQTGNTWHSGYTQLGGVQNINPPNVVGDPVSLEVGSSGTNVGTIRMASDDNFLNPFTGFVAFGVARNVFDLILEGAAGSGGHGRRVFTENDALAYSIEAYVGAATVTQGGVKYTIYKSNGVGGTANLASTDLAFRVSQKSGPIFDLYGTGNLDIGGRIKTADGTVTDPGMIFSTNDDGFYMPASGVVGVSSNGSAPAWFSYVGGVSIWNYKDALHIKDLAGTDTLRASVSGNVTTLNFGNSGFTFKDIAGNIFFTSLGNGSTLTLNSTFTRVIVDAPLKTTGNLLVKTDSAGTNAAGVLALSNTATAPSDSSDLVQLYGIDISAGNATLGLFTETAVAVDVALVSTHSLTIFINGTKYKIPLVTA